MKSFYFFQFLSWFNYYPSIPSVSVFSLVIYGFLLCSALTCVLWFIHMLCVLPLCLLCCFFGLSFTFIYLACVWAIHSLLTIIPDKMNLYGIHDQFFSPRKTVLHLFTQMPCLKTECKYWKEIKKRGMSCKTHWNQSSDITFTVCALAITVLEDPKTNVSDQKYHKAELLLD